MRKRCLIGTWLGWSWSGRQGLPRSSKDSGQSMRQKPLRLYCVALLSCILSGVACQRQTAEPEHQAPDDTPGELTLTAEQQQAIGLTTAPAIAQLVRPTIESFGRV